MPWLTNIFGQSFNNLLNFDIFRIQLIFSIKICLYKYNYIKRPVKNNSKYFKMRVFKKKYICYNPYNPVLTKEFGSSVKNKYGKTF